jgi:hypothetical protein
VKNFGEEVGVTKIYESLARYLENFQMGISIYSIDRETQEEKKIEFLSLDISQILFENRNNWEVNFCFDKMRTMQIQYLKVKI